jgi:hypothetical protein
MELFSEANTFLDSADRYEPVLVGRGGLVGSDFKGGPGPSAFATPAL